MSGGGWPGHFSSPPEAFSSSSRPHWTSLHHEFSKRAKEQAARSLEVQVLGTHTVSFCSSSHKASPDSRGYRNRLHFLLGGAAKSLQGLMWDRSECSGHLCKQTYHTYWKTCLCGTESSRITKNLMQVGVKRVTKSQVLKSSEHKGVGSDVI